MSSFVRCFRAFGVALLFLAAVAPQAGAAGGTVSGAIAGPMPKSGHGDVSVQALSGATGQVVATATPSARGTFSLKLPADGAYVIRTTVVVGGKAPATTSMPVSVKKGQKRKGLRLTPKRKKASKKALASRAYVQEHGQVTAGVTAFSVESFTGGTGDWSYLGKGLTDMLITDLLGEATPKCKTAVIANAQDRKMIEHELDLQKSKYFDPATRVKRNFIISDMTVNGTLTTAADGQSSAVHVTITDSRSGQVIDTVDATIQGEQFFEQEVELAKAVAERVCRRPAAYKLTLGVDGTGNFATHSAAGRLDSTLTALRSGGAAGELPTAWSGVGSMAWANITFASKIGECFYTSPSAPTVSWSAQLTLSGEANVKVDWNPVGNDSTTGTVNCTDSKGHIASVAGQPGPALLGIQPASAVLPLAGGTIPLSGGFTSGSDGWTNTGTLVVEPIWSKDPPK